MTLPRLYRVMRLSAIARDRHQFGDPPVVNSGNAVCDVGILALIARAQPVALRVEKWLA